MTPHTPIGDSPDRSSPGTRHAVLDAPLDGPWPEGTEILYLAMGCFWGTERIFWRLPGVVSTAAGYQGGHTADPTYPAVCSGTTGHAETVRVVYDPQVTGPEQLLKAFWENHDPTTPNRQGNDIGTQYRSAIHWTTPEQERAAELTREAFGAALREAGHHAPICTEIRPATEAGPFHLAEEMHQQYLHRNPNGYCNHGPNGVTCPVGLMNGGSTPAQTEVLPPGSVG